MAIKAGQRGVAIYALIDPRSDLIRYIGRSIDPISRLSGHLSDAANKGTHKARWLRGLIASGGTPRLVILEWTDESGSAAVETRWILGLRGLGVRLTNATDGGDGVFGWTPTDQNRDNMRASAKRRCSSPQERERMRSITNRRPPVRSGALNNAKLTEGQVAEIRRLHEAGESGVALARQFGVTPQNISLIVNGRAWAHLQEA